MRYTLRDFIEDSKDSKDRAKHFMYECQGKRYTYDEVIRINILMTSDILVDYMNFIVKIR